MCAAHDGLLEGFHLGPLETAHMLQLGRRDHRVDELVVRDGAVAVDVHRPRDGVQVLPPARSKAGR
jgi:hypothetical protein